MKVKSYDEFVNEEISRKGMIGAMGGAMLGLGAIGAGAAYYRDKQVMKYIKLFEEIHIHDRWEQESIEKEDIKQFAETLFVNLLDEDFTVNTDVIYSELVSEYSQDPNKYVSVYIINEESRRTPLSDSFDGNIKYSHISNEIQTFVDYIKRKWKIIDTTYEYEQHIVPENIDDSYIKTFKKSKEPSAETTLFNGRFNLTITQLDKEPNMFQKFIKRF